MKYHAHRSPRTLTTTDDHLREYPHTWELLKWYKCWRKVPYPTEILAAILADERSEDYRHYPCPIDSTHWHIGRGGNQANPKYLIQRAKRCYRKAVRDEIWAEYEERNRVDQEEKDV